MNRLEVRGLMSLLQDAKTLLERHGYSSDIPNGRSCLCCNESGSGSTEPHSSTCTGVQLLIDIHEALMLVGEKDLS